MQHTMISHYARRNRFTDYVGTVDTSHGELVVKFQEEYYGHRDPDNNVEESYTLNGKPITYMELQDYFSPEDIERISQKAWATKRRV